MSEGHGAIPVFPKSIDQTSSPIGRTVREVQSHAAAGEATVEYAWAWVRGGFAHREAEVRPKRCPDEVPRWRPGWVAWALAAAGRTAVNVP